MTREGDYLVTAAEAAAEVGVTRATIDTWVHRGYLTAIDPTTRPRRYWASHIFSAEASRAHNMRRAPDKLAKDSEP